MFITSPLFLRAMKFGRPGGGTDKYWRVQQYLRLSWNFRGRKQNCYGIGMRYVHKALMYSTISRALKKEYMPKLWMQRISAASEEHNLFGEDFLEGLARCNIRLDKKVLSEIAIYEPRTFQSLTDIAKGKLDEDGVPPGNTWFKAIKKHI